MFKFEDFLGEFSVDALNHQQFLLNALLAALLAWLLSIFYSKYGRSVANRTAFSENFILLALVTMLVIYIVKSSIQLSLGLVGALSIVRFRAAIKEPEELVYLFLTIGIGLGMGANQTVITILAFVLIMAVLFIQALMKKRTTMKSPENMFLNISSKALTPQEVNTILSNLFSFVELKRMDQFKGKLDLSYIVETEDINQVVKAKEQLTEKDADINFSFMEQRNLAL